MPKQNRTYTDMQHELSEIAAWFESDDFNLDEAITKYESAQKLVKEIEAYLQTAETKITKLKAAGN